ncbi:MAG: CAP domain-containing protein [Anaerolineae bacterium]|jgi:hypothetical protein|nr:CAP domain-containing protein [Anaerolineae bacterium]
MKLLKRFLWFCLLSYGIAIATPITHSQEVVSDLLGRINTLRSSLGLNPYTLNGSLTSAAQSHAQWMANTGSVSHTQPDGSTPTTRAAAAGYVSSFVSENIYAGTNATANDAWNFWINSPIHYRGLTNAGYTEIGIGYATTSWGRAFVLVFGSPGNPYVAPRNSSSGGSSGNTGRAAPPPSFVVGRDNYGNIMHEVQPGHDLGTIALLYGYTWDDLPYIREINGLTEEEGRLLAIGGIILIPPFDGTYTPTALPEGYPTLTPTLDPNFQPSPTPTFDLMSQLFVASATIAAPPPTMTSTLPTARIRTAVQVPTLDSSPTLTPATALITDSTAIAALPTVSEPITVSVPRTTGLSPWLIVAILAQVTLVTVASIEFYRRNRR